MVQIFGIEFSIVQILLIIAIFIVAPLGYWNQKRMIKKKQEAELLGEDPKNTQSNSSAQSQVSQEIENQAKEYIQQYQDSYPKESIQQGLLSIGVNNEQAVMLLDKYYKK